MSEQNFTQMYHEYKGKLKGQWDVLEPRTRVLLLLLLAVIVFSFCVNLIFKPQRSSLYRIKQELVSVKNRIVEVQSQIPDLEEEKQLLMKVERSLRVLTDELADLEKNLPHQDSLPNLLRELVKQTSGYALDFRSIKPIASKDKKDYERLNIEMQFTTNYSGLVNYLHRLERISQFITISDILIEESQDELVQGIDVTLKLTTLLGERIHRRNGGQAIGIERKIKKIQLSRNPFRSDFKPSVEGEFTGEYKLSGIVSEGKFPTAIINDEVYKIGDWIGTNKILDISSNSVTLKAGQESIVLSLKEK